MSSKVTGNGAVDIPSEVVIVDSQVIIKLANVLGASCPVASVYLQEFTDARWNLFVINKHGTSNEENSQELTFLIITTKFPEELSKDCFIEFSVSLVGDAKPKIWRKDSFKPTFNGGVMTVDGTVISFIANLVVKKKSSICSTKFLRKNLLDNIIGMRLNGKLTDFTFIVKEKQFKVDKLILAASSVVMDRLFTAEYQEKQTSECKVNDIEPDIFGALISFMYSCTVPENLKDIAHELYAAAHYYEIEALKEICLDEVQKNLSKANVTKSYAFAFKYDLEKLITDAWIIVKRDILKVHSANVKPMPPDEVAKILAIRQQKDDEIGAIRQKEKAKADAFLQMEQAVLEQYTEAGSEEPKHKKYRFFVTSKHPNEN